jgi:hypothetical protein
MVAKNGTSYNLGSGVNNTRESYLHSGDGVYSREAYPACPSDYEAIDVTPMPAKEAKPGWRDAFPAFTHNMSWVDGDGCSHSMTLRSDSLADLMNDLKLLKSIIKQSKAQAAAKAPQQTTQTQAEAASEPAQPDTQRCKLHAVDMVRRWSKRTQGHYFAHQAPDGNFCYGRAAKA